MLENQDHQGLSSEVPVGPDNGLNHDGVVSLDNVLTVPVDAIGRTIESLTSTQEAQLARAVVLAYDLDVPCWGSPRRRPTAPSNGLSRWKDGLDRTASMPKRALPKRGGAAGRGVR